MGTSNSCKSSLEKEGCLKSQISPGVAEKVQTWQELPKSYSDMKARGTQPPAARNGAEFPKVSLAKGARPGPSQLF